jgi:hypothetical protein
VFEAPSNLLLKRFKPSIWQSRIMISWGIALLAHVGVQNKEGIYATRFLLGLVRSFETYGYTKASLTTRKTV